MRFETEALRDTCFYGIGVNHGGMGDASPKKKFTVGDGYITIPPIRMVNWTADKTGARVLLRKQRDMYAFSILPPPRKISVLHPFPK